MFWWLKVNWVEIKINHKFDNLSDPVVEKVADLVKRWFENKMDSYLEKFVSPENKEAHLNMIIEKTDKWQYNGNFNLKVGEKNVIYKREWFEDIMDLVNHFFMHAKEEFSKK